LIEDNLKKSIKSVSKTQRPREKQTSFIK